MLANSIGKDVGFRPLLRPMQHTRVGGLPQSPQDRPAGRGSLAAPRGLGGRAPVYGPNITIQILADTAMNVVMGNSTLFCLDTSPHHEPDPEMVALFDTYAVATRSAIKAGLEQYRKTHPSTCKSPEHLPFFMLQLQ